MSSMVASRIEEVGEADATEVVVTNFFVPTFVVSCGICWC